MSPTAPLETVRSVFADALELPARARAAFVSKACGGDAALEREVTTLLEAHADDTFLEGPAWGAARSLADLETAETAARTTIGGYRVRRLIGAGGSALVYEAESAESGEVVALKVLRARGNSGAKAALEMHREARALARLRHPGLARVIDAGTTADGLRFVAMERVEGETLDRYLTKRKPSRAERLDLFDQLLSAVEHAHRRGVVHRDLKPANIMITPPRGGERFGKICVLDFGLAKLFRDDAGAPSAWSETGAIVGTLATMSPEQASGRSGAVGPASDVYALGVLLYELLAGHAPYPTGGGSPAHWLRSIEHARPLPLPANVARGLRAVVGKALEKNASLRYADAGALRRDYQRAARRARTAAEGDAWIRWARRGERRARKPALFAASLAAAFAGGWFATKERGESALLRSGEVHIVATKSKRPHLEISEFEPGGAWFGAAQPMTARFEGAAVPFEAVVQPNIMFRSGAGSIDLERKAAVFFVSSTEDVADVLDAGPVRKIIEATIRTNR